MMKPKQSRTLMWSFVFLLPLLVISCYPEGPAVTEDLDLVGTQRDTEYNFTSALTYSMPDTVIHVVEESVKPEDIDRSYDELILTNVKNNMSALGFEYRDLDTTQLTDVVMLVSVYENVNTSFFFNGGGWWGFWGWWPGWGGAGPWGPGWGVGVPWGFPTGYTYTTGTIFISMVDPDIVDLENETVGLVWLAALNGLTSGDKSRAEARITDGIAQAFKQSEYYLKK